MLPNSVITLTLSSNNIQDEELLVFWINPQETSMVHPALEAMWVSMITVATVVHAVCDPCCSWSVCLVPMIRAVLEHHFEI